MLTKEKKAEEVEEVKNLINDYSVIGLINMHALPGRQLHKIREKLRGIAIIKMIKKTLLTKAINESSKKDLSKIIEKISDKPALIFTNENPFRLFKILKESRMPAAAKAGAITIKDIIIQKGPTSLPPGPGISTLQKVGLKTSVQGGKIAVMADKVVLKSGEKFGEDLVGVLSLLKIEPMEIGLDVVCTWDDGIIFDKSVLDISVKQYLSDIQKCVQNAVNLSVNTGYPTKLTIEMMISKAFGEAKNLCIEAKIIEKDFIGDVLANAVREASALESCLK
ncbi:MAG TPA: 50S ribosomal protein L10 [archaeon]|nr:50S ribosomal protein L10 [archaeon]